MSYNYMHVSVPVQHLYIYNKYYLCVQSKTHTGNFYISRECQILTVNSKWAQSSMNEADGGVFCRYEVSSAFQDPVRSMLLAYFELTDKKTKTGNGSLTFLTNNRSHMSSSFRRMPIHKSSSSTLFWSLGALKVFHWHDPTLSIYPYTLTHTEQSILWASPGIIPLTAYTCGCWYGLLRKGFLNTHLCYTHCLPTPNWRLGMLFSPVFSALASIRTTRVCQCPAIPFTGRIRTAKTLLSSSPTPLGTFYLCLFAFRLKTRICTLPFPCDMVVNWSYHSTDSKQRYRHRVEKLYRKPAATKGLGASNVPC